MITTPDSWIERRPEYPPPEGAIWCADCGEWITEPCEHEEGDADKADDPGYALPREPYPNL